MIEPGGAKHNFVFGNAANDTPKRFTAKMQDGGIVANLRMVPGEAAMTLLGLAAVQSEIGKPPGKEAQESESTGPPLEQALSCSWSSRLPADHWRPNPSNTRRRHR